MGVDIWGSRVHLGGGHQPGEGLEERVVSWEGAGGGHPCGWVTTRIAICTAIVGLKPKPP